MNGDLAGLLVNLINEFERLVGHVFYDINLCQKQTGEQIVGSQLFYAIEFRGGLMEEVEIEKNAALFETEIGIVEGAIVVHDLIPTTVSAKGVFNRFGNLAGDFVVGLEVLVTVEIDLGDQVVLVEFESALEMAGGTIETLLFLHLGAPVVESA